MAIFDNLGNIGQIKENSNEIKNIKDVFNTSRTMYQHPSQLGFVHSNQDIKLIDLINAMDAKSHIQFWISDGGGIVEHSQYLGIYNEILEGIKVNYPGVTEIYGNVEIWKTDGTTTVTAYDYQNTSNVYISRYTTVNNLGWRGWEKINTGIGLEEIGTTISKFAEVGYAENNMVVYATIGFQKLSKTKCNLYISYKIASNNAPASAFDFISVEKIKKALGISKLHGSGASQVIFTTVYENPNGDLNILAPHNTEEAMGYTGIHADLKDERAIQLGRFYTESGGYGSRTLSNGIYKEGTYGQINLYGVSYSI